MNLLIQIGIYALTLWIGSLLREEPSLPDKTTFEELDVPKITDGTTIPVVFGTVEIKSPSVFWYGDFNSKSTSSGVYNYLGFGYIWCLNPVDSLNRIFIDGSPIFFAESSVAWSVFYGNNYDIQIPPTERLDKVSSNLKIGMIFSDPKFKALNVDVRFGETSQLRSSYLIDKQETDLISADRGLVSTVFENNDSLITYNSQTVIITKAGSSVIDEVFASGVYVYQKTLGVISAEGIVINTNYLNINNGWSAFISINVTFGLFDLSIIYNENDDIYMEPLSYTTSSITPIATTNNIYDKSCMFGVGRNTIPNISMVFERTQKDWNGDLIWEPTLATITQEYILSGVTKTINQMNGVHIIRDILISKNYGLGGDYPSADIDETSFLSAAITCFDEGMGFGVLISSSETKVNEVIKDIILSRINGKLYRNNEGKWVLKLLRDDYIVDTLPVFDESDIIEVTDWKKDSPAVAVNSVTVKYTNPSNFVQKGITARSTADIQLGGTERRREIVAPEIYSSDLAALIASRDLQASMSGLSAFKLTGKRTMYSLNIGDVFKMNYEDASGLVIRVLEIDKGDFTGKMEFTCIEDIFNAGSVIISSDEQNGGGVINQPQPAENRTFFATPYMQYLIDVEMDLLANDLQDNLTLIATAPTGDATSFIPNINDSNQSPEIPFLDNTKLVDDISIFNEVITLTSVLDLPEMTTTDLLQDPIFLLIGSELVALTLIDNINNVAVIVRGQLDTIPQPHSSGENVFVAVWRNRSYGTELGNYIENTLFVDGNEIDIKMLTRTSLGILPLSSAPVDNFTFDTRQVRPYRPDNILVNTIKYDEEYLIYILQGTDTSLTWVERNRLTQRSYLGFEDPTVSPESGTTYKLVIKETNDTIVDTIVGVTGVSYNYTNAQEVLDFGSESDKKIDIYSVRDGYDSFTNWSITIRRFFDLVISVNEVTENFEILNNNIGCDVYYTITTDGSEPGDPTTGDTLYLAPFSFQNDFYIKAKAFCGSFESPLYKAKWIILNGVYDTTDSIYTILNTYDTNN